MEFRILGSLEVVRDGVSVELGGFQQRALLAVLLLNRRLPVSTDRLIEELWREGPPATASKAVQVYVSRLRKTLGDGVLVTRGGGYALDVAPQQVDADRFESLASEGRGALESGDPQRAARRLREALELWRGPPLADLQYEAFARAGIGRLEEERVAALGDRIDAELSLGEHQRLVGELDALAREHPLHERFQAQLMLALYRSGRQADALERYQQARRRLVDELGVEPGPALRDLERAILVHDPSLDAPKRTATAARPRRRRATVPVLVGAAVLLGAVVAIAISLTGSASNTVRVAPNSLAVIDTRSDSIVGAVAVGARPGSVAFGFGSLWVANQDDQTVSRVDPGTLSTDRTLSLTGTPTGLAASASAIWAVESNSSGSTVFVNAIDPQFDTVGPMGQLGNVVRGGPAAVAARGNTVWVAPSSGLLARLDPATGHLVQQLDPNSGPAAIALGDGATWVTDTAGNNVTRIDPTGLFTAIAVGNGPTGVAVGDGGVWVADSLDDTVVRIDPDTTSVTTTIPVGRSPAGIAVGAGSVWVANSGDGTVSRIDPATGSVTATIPVGGSPEAIALADGRAWVTVDARTIASSPPASSDTLRIESASDVDSMDPALAYQDNSWQLLYAACAKLLNYPDVSGPAGSRLIPEVARSLPAVSADGRTYTFRIRSGFRFSPPSNAAVTAETFKDTIERTLNPRMNSPTANYLADIVGAGAYMAGKASHIAGVTASGDTLTIHLLHPEPDFPARIALPSFCAVPPGTPIDPKGLPTIPSAGPYYVASYTPGQGVVLERNPNYHGSRPRQFARIELAVGISEERAVADIEAGHADYTPFESTQVIAGAISARLAARYGPGKRPQQYFVKPLLQLDYFILNTHRPLFADARMRQAVNFAIDRRALAALGDAYQALPERPAEHYLPPSMPGYSDAQVYPFSPNLTRARHLADRVGATAVLYTCNSPPCPEQAQILRTDLAAIGLRLQVETFPQATLSSLVSKPNQPFDLAYSGWLADYPDPSGMLDPLLSDSAVEPTFTDPRYQRRLAAAAQLSGPARYLAYGKLDVELAGNAAPLVVFGNLSSHDFFSARIGCQTYGIYGVDVAALCARSADR